MSSQPQAHRLNIQALARQAVPLVASTLLQNMKRLAKETQAPRSDLSIQWEARAEYRPRPGFDDEVWLHLEANMSVPLTCQRCLGAVLTPLRVDQWYRFVATEDIAMAEDDQSEEDLLVMEPQFDLLALLEDELLMALPPVPMHDSCPIVPTPLTGNTGGLGESAGRPNPFAALAQLNKNK